MGRRPIYPDIRPWEATGTKAGRSIRLAILYATKWAVGDRTAVATMAATHNLNYGDTRTATYTAIEGIVQAGVGKSSWWARFAEYFFG